MSFQPSKKTTEERSCPLPEVADQPAGETAHDLSLAIDPRTEDLIHHREYTVFLKRNLRPLTPPADLLANLRTALAAVDAEKA